MFLVADDASQYLLLHWETCSESGLVLLTLTLGLEYHLESGPEVYRTRLL